MIDANELRLGNYIMHKTGVRVLTVKCDYKHFELLSRGEAKDIFPVSLKPDVLEKCGFIENKKYPLLPEAREFILTLPVMGSADNEIRAYIKSNKESFARAVLNNIPVSNTFYYLHQLQNLYFSLTGRALDILL